MIEPHPILGFFFLLGGLLMIALNHTTGQSYEEGQKALGKRGSPKHAYIVGRIVTIAAGSFIVLLGAVMLYNFLFST